MPMRLPAKVSISPKAMRTLLSITPAGGMAIPAVSNAHPTVHIAAARRSWMRFIIVLTMYVFTIYEFMYDLRPAGGCTIFRYRVSDGANNPIIPNPQINS